MPKYDITVRLLGQDGNALNVLGLVGKALKEAKVPMDQMELFYQEAMEGDYDHLLQTCMRWVNIN
jgi:hypothetical protein